MAELLIEAQADVNAQDSRDNTPLHLTTYTTSLAQVNHNRDSVARLLVSHGAHTHPTNRYVRWALFAPLRQSPLSPPGPHPP